MPAATLYRQTSSGGLALLAVAGCLLTSATAQEPSLTTRPNVVLIVADDLGYGELGCYGGREIPTPAIDSLASAGVRFTNGYVTAPFCAASRAGLLTGRYQTRFGFELNPIGPQNADPAIGLPTSERTIADYLREAGYATGLVGKWHQGGTARFRPQRRGFDEFFGFLHEGHYYVPPPWEGHVTWLRRKALPDGSQGRWTSPDGRAVWSTHMRSFEPAYDTDNPIVRQSQPVEERENLTDAFTREAESFIERHAGQPFFLYLAYSAVHSPLQGADAYLAKFAHIDDIQRRIFAAMLAQLDDGVGRVRKKLAETGIAERTLVIFTSDNGGPTRELTSSNRPLRGEKGELLEGGIRVPFIVSWPAQLPAGKTESRMVSSLDLLPTALTASNVVVPQNLDGVSLLEPLTASDAPPIRREHYWRIGSRAAFRQDQWKLHRPAANRPWELYDLETDPGESRNLAAENLTAENAEQLTKLVAAWTKLDEEMIDPLWGRSGGQGTGSEGQGSRKSETNDQ
jgi:arylsulfatase A-like enzyme